MKAFNPFAPRSGKVYGCMRCGRTQGPVIQERNSFLAGLARGPITGRRGAMMKRWQASRTGGQSFSLEPYRQFIARKQPLNVTNCRTALFRVAEFPREFANPNISNAPVSQMR